MSFASRYLSGDHVVVWSELEKLGNSVRLPHFVEDASEVARLTMLRVLRNVLIIEEELSCCGYRFNASTLRPAESIIRLPNEHDLEALYQIEQEMGSLPLSISAFFSVLGEIDLSQHFEQFVQWLDRENGSPYSELEVLGEYGPLVISSPSFMRERAISGKGEICLPIMPDESARAFYSGDYYYIWIPNLHVDARIGSSHPTSETFVAYLRQSFQHGGFHGMPLDGMSNSWKFPTMPNIDRISKYLLPI